MKKQWVCYLVECKDGTYYCGITNDLLKRIDTHNKGKGAKYTRCRLPVTLLTYKECDNRSKASKLEYAVKQQPRNKKIEFLNKPMCG
jgi:putative endonuclease